MTMPDERTRALRFGWEFLLELREEPNLTDEQRGTVAEILRHYPCAAEIKAWAKDCEQTRDPLFGAQMAPEEPQPGCFDRGVLAVAQTIQRGATTPQQRTLALCRAYAFFRFGLSGSGRNHLPERLRRQIPYVLRHFPDNHEIQSWALSDAYVGRMNPGFRQWLMPQEKL